MLENVVDAPRECSGSTPKSVLVTVTELNQFSRLVRTLGTGSWIFRGHADKDWKLASSLERQLLHNESALSATNYAPHGITEVAKYNRYRASDEMYAIDLFKRHARTRLPNLEHLVEWLAAMQHYGTSTRLLDFSRSIYVALYFAFEDRLKKTDAAIYAIQYADLLHSKTLRKKLIADQTRKLARKKLHVDGKELEALGMGSEEYIKTNYYKNRKELQDSLIDMADKCISNPMDKPGIIPVSVPGVNERLVAQAGLFLMPQTFSAFTENLSTSLDIDESEIGSPRYCFKWTSYPNNKKILNEASLIKIVIERKLQAAMWNMLAQANVSALNLFPGLEGIAQSIRYDEPLYD